jgi:hypothetical protein
MIWTIFIVFFLSVAWISAIIKTFKEEAERDRNKK